MYVLFHFSEEQILSNQTGFFLSSLPYIVEYIFFLAVSTNMEFDSFDAEERGKTS